MKKLFLITVFINVTFLASTMYAQPSVASRLISEAHFTINSADFPYADSLRYIYSGHRGGDLTHTIKSDTTARYLYGTIHSGTASASGNPSGMYVNTYDAHNNLSTQEGLFINGSTLLFQPYQLSAYTYDSNNILLGSISQTWDTGSKSWKNASKQLYAYDGMHNLLIYVDQTWDPVLSKWVNNYADSFSYSSAGKLLSHIEHYWNVSGNANRQLLYTYDLSGNNTVLLQQIWQSGTWVNDIQNIYSYGSTNDKQSDMSLRWDNTVLMWDTTTRDLYTYNTAHDMLTDLNQYRKSGIWQNASIKMYTYDVNHNQLFDTLQTWNISAALFVNAERIKSTYNGFNQLLTATTENWNGSNWGGDSTGGHEEMYYYESFSTSVTSVANPIDNILLYPLPASNTLNINIKWNAPQPFTISVFDIQGRRLQQISYPATLQTQVILPVSQLLSGNYFIRVSTPDNIIDKQFVIIH